MDNVKTVALVAHDNRKPDLIEWVDYNASKLAKHHLICTGTTGKMVEKALLRITVLYNVPTACNRSTADFLVDSPHFEIK